MLGRAMTRASDRLPPQRPIIERTYPVREQESQDCGAYDRRALLVLANYGSIHQRAFPPEPTAGRPRATRPQFSGYNNATAAHTSSDACENHLTLVGLPDALVSIVVRQITGITQELKTLALAIRSRKTASTAEIELLLGYAKLSGPAGTSAINSLFILAKGGAKREALEATNALLKVESKASSDALTQLLHHRATHSEVQHAIVDFIAKHPDRPDAKRLLDAAVAGCPDAGVRVKAAAALP